MASNYASTFFQQANNNSTATPEHHADSHSIAASAAIAADSAAIHSTTHATNTFSPTYMACIYVRINLDDVNVVVTANRQFQEPQKTS